MKTLNPHPTTMKTSTIEVGRLLPVLSAERVRKHLGQVPGVHHVEVNYVSQSATVDYDSARVSLQALTQRVIDCGHHCRGQMIPSAAPIPKEMP